MPALLLHAGLLGRMGLPKTQQVGQPAGHVMEMRGSGRTLVPAAGWMRKLCMLSLPLQSWPPRWRRQCRRRRWGKRTCGACWTASESDCSRPV